uniref:ANK_REP_REGION domain-containing protein n=1 Tax=Ascaris lumbricoides TaxID=6252 RepID=A0A0M3IMR2_ASCLU
MSRRVQIDGKIYPWDGQPDHMIVSVDSALLHIGIDGAVGSLKSSKEKSTSKSPDSLVDVLTFRLSGSLANFGRIASQSEIEMRIDGSLLSLKDGRIDSATRGYEALKQIKGIVSESSVSLPTSSTLSTAIVCQNPDTVAQLLEDGVDPNDSIINESTAFTPRRIAAKKYREIRIGERRNKLREKITLIQALMSTHDWKRGLITSNVVVAKIGRDCGDCAQFRASTLILTTRGNAKCEADSIWSSGSVTLTIGNDLNFEGRDCGDCAQFRASTLILTTRGSAKCEADSIWSSGSVTLTIGNDLNFEGQVKHRHVEVSCGGNVTTTEDAIISEENWAKISCTSFNCAGIWSVGEQISIEAHSAEFITNSYMEVDLFDAKIEGNCCNAGTWQMRFISLSLDGNLITSPSGKVLIDETADVSAVAFNCSGAWKVNESIQMSLRGPVNFFSSSHISANLLKMIVEGHGTFAGYLVVDNLLAYIRNDLVTAPTAKIAISNGGTIATGMFRNDANWLSECSLHFHVACFEQSEDAIIFVKDTFNMIVYDDSEENSHGRIVANYCTIRANRKFRFDGYLRVNQIELNVPYVNESKITIGGQLEVLTGALVIKGHSELTGSSQSLSPHQWPAFVLEGQLKAEAVIAPFLAIRFATSSYALLSGMNSIMKAPCRTLVSAGALYTMHTALIDSVSNDTYPEGIMCATVWIHEGQIRFRGQSAFVIVDSFLNKGRLTNEGKLQNHMKEIFLTIANYFCNDAVLSADKIHISGDGELQNKNRVFANDVMDIRLSNFSTEIERIQSETIKLLSANKETTKINGRFDVKNNSENSSSKFSTIMKNFDAQKQVRLNTRAQLFVSNDINDEFGSVTLTARDAIIFDANILLDGIELTLGTSYKAEMIVSEHKMIRVNHLRIGGKCKHLTIIIDGCISCGSIIIENSLRQVKIIGKGTMRCLRSMNIAGEAIIFTMKELYANEILATSVTFNAIVHSKISPTETSQALSVYSDRCFIHGRLLIEGKLCLKASKGIVKIDGNIMGTSMNSELSVECDDLILSGDLANLEFLEIYARKRIEFCETAIIKNSRNAAMEAEFIAFDGKVTNCEVLLATAEEVAIDGSLYNENSIGSYSIFGKIIRFDGNANGMAHLELNSANDLILNCSMNNINEIEVDSKWMNWHANMTNCYDVNVTAYSAVLSGTISSQSISIHCLGSIFNRCTINSSNCSICAPFVFAFGQTSSLPENTEMSAFIFSNDRNDSNANRINSGNAYLHIKFDENSEEIVSSRQFEIWKQAIHLLGETFHSPSIVLDEFLAILKYVGEIQPTTIILPTSSQLYKDLSKTAAKFGLEHVSLFSPPKFIAALRSYQSKLLINDQNNIDEPITMTRFAAESMYELANRFRIRSKKYAPNSLRYSAEDGGYASRSSSEDIDEKKTIMESPTVCYDNEIAASSFKVISEGVDDVERELDSEQSAITSRLIGVVTHDEFAESSGDESTSHRENSTRYVMNGEHRIAIDYVDFKKLDIVISKPRLEMPRRAPSTTDLAMKKMKVKMALSNLDLRSFGSESSLASFDAAEGGTPMRMVPSPAKRSLIPRSSFRRALTPIV